MKVKKLEQVNKENVKCSQFGCTNCLWASIECKGQSKFKARIAMGKPSCVAYAYYD